MKNENQIFSDLKKLLRFASVSADPAYDLDCRECADWLKTRIAEMDFDAECVETPAHPCVFAVRKGNPAKPSVLFYGHYDVQPVDPLHKWKFPPFEPRIHDGRIYARGAQDNKGQLWFVLSAINELISSGTDLPTIKILIEGDEESGSEGLLKNTLPGINSSPHHPNNMLHTLPLSADIMLVCDTVTVGSGRPTIILGLRGLVHLDIELQGPHKDLHSGVHGGLAPNPLNGMACLIASLWNADGSIAVNDFYNKIIPPTAQEQQAMNLLDFNAADYAQQTGVLPLAGENHLPAMERLGFRPSLDVNGMLGGYTGAGPKTVIPAIASAKISCRLAAGQEPEECLDGLKEHLKEHLPTGLRLNIKHAGAIGAGFRLPVDSDEVKNAAAVLDTLGMGPTAYLWEGASIPVIPALAAASGARPLLVGFGQEEDNIHAPNESFATKRFELGFRFVTEWLSLS